MSRVAKFEFALWAVSLVFGASLLYAETRIASRRVSQDDVMPAWVMRYDSQRAFESAAVPMTVMPPLATESTSVSDQRRVASLLVDSVVQIESMGNPRLVGSRGERGLMQIKAGTWSDMTRRVHGSRIPFDRAFEAKLNREIGAAYLAYLQDLLHRNRRLWKADERSLLLACYNAGPERVKQAGFDLRRLPAHTIDYVKRGSALHDAFLADHNLTMRQIALTMASAAPVTARGS